MSRLMSVTYTVDAVRERRKRVTRRKGWWLDKRGRRLVVPGDHLTLCEKVMGRKPGQPLVRICDVEVVDVRREPLGLIYDEPNGLELEGFSDLYYYDFVRFYFLPQGIHPWDDVTRIEWRYLDGDAS